MQKSPYFFELFGSGRIKAIRIPVQLLLFELSPNLYMHAGLDNSEKRDCICRKLQTEHEYEFPDMSFVMLYITTHTHAYCMKPGDVLDNFMASSL